MFELELKQPTSKDKDEKWACGYFPKRVWYKSVEDERLLVKFNNCDAAFMSSLMVNLSSDVIMTNKTSFRLCSSACLEDHRCSAVSYNGEDGNCVFALNAFKFHRDGRAVMDFWNWNLLQFQRDGFKLSSTAATATFIGSRKCGIITSRVWNPEANYSWRNGCKFEADYFETIDIKNSNSSISPIKQCSELCFNNLGCAHFNVEKKVCVLIWEWVESVLLEETNEKKWFQLRFHDPAANLERVDPRQKSSLMSNCTFIDSYSPFINLKTVVITNNRSFISCKDKCLSDHRCVAFSYDSRDEKCFIPPAREEYLNRPLILYHRALLFPIFRIITTTVSSSSDSICAMIPDRLWKEFHLLPDEGDDTDEQYVWQENSDFDTSNNAVAHRQQFILDNNPHNVSSMMEWCASHCLNNPSCVHFNVDKNKNCFVLTNTSPLIERMAVEGGACGYFFDRPNIWTYKMMKR